MFHRLAACTFFQVVRHTLSGIDMEFVAKFQKIDPEKFTELCRMHLTFALDLHDDEFSALLNNKSESKNRRGLSYFSRRLKEKTGTDVAPLTQESISQVYQIIEYLGRDINICQEGLFRKTGSLSRQQELKALLNAGATIDFSLGHYSAHDCASVLKNYLSELPEPLLSETHYSAHCQISNMYKEDMTPSQKEQIFLRQLKSTRLLFLLLPQENICLLKYLLLLLSQVKIDHEKNKMTAANLATVFAPQILCPRKMTAETFKRSSVSMVKCVAFMIENATLLFEPPLELVQDVTMYLNDNSSANGFQLIKTENEAVKTVVAFCERTNTGEQSSGDYTQKALTELHSYIQNLPNSARKRKLIKKFQNENSHENGNECRRRHFRSRSVGEAIKKHLWKSSNKRKDGFYKEYHHASYDMLTSSSSDTSHQTAVKASSVDALNLERRLPNSSKFAPLGKNFLRASKKMKMLQSEKLSRKTCASSTDM